MAQSTRNIPQLDLPTPSPPSANLNRPKLGTNATTARTATSQRLPPPTLFQGPPSKNASHISLALPSETHREDRRADTGASGGRGAPRPSKVPPATSFSAPSGRPPSLKPPPTQADDFRAESLWAEMQNTLADVELSAMNPSHVFGAGHAKALEDLRTAQLGLAQAWAKSAADEVQGEGGGGVSDGEEDGVVGAMGTKASPEKKGKAGVAVGSSFANNKNLEEETDRDIELARKRRDANDRYFSQVNKGVLDVVGRLDEVASAMRRVEKESREIWESSDGDDGDDDEMVSGEDEVTDTEESAMANSPDSPVRKR